MTCRVKESARLARMCHTFHRVVKARGKASIQVVSISIRMLSMKSVNRFVVLNTVLCVSALSVSLVASAQLPKLDTQPGKWSYSTRTEIPGIGSIPMNFDQCVTQKDIDEGRNLSAQKQAGVDCKYTDLKQSGDRYQFTATCTSKDVPEPTVMRYDMTATATRMNSKMVMTGGTTKAMGGKVNMTMTAKRFGDC